MPTYIKEKILQYISKPLSKKKTWARPCCCSYSF